MLYVFVIIFQFKNLAALFHYWVDLICSLHLLELKISCGNIRNQLREGLKKNTTNLGFWLKLGGEGVRGGSRAPTKGEIGKVAKLAGWRNWQGDEMGRVMKFPGD